MKSLVIAEKPSVGRDIARVLGCRPSGNGCMEGSSYVVTWALGHLVTLADPEAYDKKYKKWEINDLPIMPDKMRLNVIPQTSKQYGVVNTLLHRKDVSTIIIATDAGREGELVARWIIEKAKCNKPIKRLWISSVTDKAIKEGFANLKDGKLYDGLRDSAKARAEADWLVGINATRCLSTKFNGQLSCGRVQTPTIAIIAKREDEIRKFIPKKFFGITANAVTAKAEAFGLTWVDSANSSRCFNKERIDGVMNDVKSITTGTVKDVIKMAKKKMPPKLYDLTELQRDANKRYGFSPKDTLSIMQNLYERHKILTYPRTDSRYIPTDVVPTLSERIKACAVKQYAKMCMQILRAPIKTNNSFVDNSKVSDHHAIIPTEQPVDLSDLDERERKIYDLVVTRFLAVFYPPFEYEQTSIKVRIGNEMFVAKGKTVLKNGYMEVYKGSDDDDDNSDKDNSGIKEQMLPKLVSGDRVGVKGFKLTEGKTSPPAPFNEATLLSAMENPAKYMETDDKALASTLEKTGGLGTVATRADIIEKLFASFMLEKKGKDIFTTSKGRQILTLCPKDLKSPEMTGIWEQKLTKISKGEIKKDEFLREIRKYTGEIIKDIKNSTETFRHDNLSSTRCPECGLPMLEVAGKKGKMLVCQDRECGSRMSVSQTTRTRCPHCGKNLDLVGEGEKRRAVCGCGFSEKFDAYEKRRKEENDKLSKREVKDYIDKLNKTDVKDEKDNPFASLKGLKF